VASSLSGPLLAGVAVIAAATLAGFWLAARSARLPAVILTCAAVALAAVVLADLAPDVWRDLRGSGPAWWTGAAAALAAGYAAAEALARRGCACRADAPRSGAAAGTATAAALAAHRTVEGAAVALTGSAVVVAALAIHAAGEGFALGALLRAQRPSRVVLLLAIACLSPFVGALAFRHFALPGRVSALMTSVVAGVFARAVVAAWPCGRARARPPTPQASARATAHAGTSLAQPGDMAVATAVGADSRRAVLRDLSLPLWHSAVT